MITLDTPDGVTLRGWHYPAASDAPYILYFYGNGGQIANDESRLAWFHDRLQLSVVAFDYRGYGFSDGRPSPRAIADDALRIYDEVVARFRPARGIFVNGWSLGTQFAIHVAAERPLLGLILQAPPTTADEQAAWYSRNALPFPFRGFLRLVPDAEALSVFRGEDEIRSVHTPLLVVHGTADRTIPVEQGRKVYESSASPDKRFVEVLGADHNDLPFTSGVSGAAVEAFVRALVLS